MHARIIKSIREYDRNFTAFVVGRAAYCNLPVGPHHRRLPSTSPTSSASAGCYCHLSCCTLPPSLPTPLAPFPTHPLAARALSSSSHPLCGRIPSRCASRRLAYVLCHTLCQRMPPHPNPDVWSSWSLSYTLRRALNTCCRTAVAPRFCWPGTRM